MAAPGLKSIRRRKGHNLCVLTPPDSGAGRLLSGRLPMSYPILEVV
jgi:hypothetical protein